MLTRERADLLESLRRHRGFLRQTVAGVSEEQARTRSTVSALTLASLIKHVADTEQGWVDFALGKPGAMGGDADFDDGFDADAMRAAMESGEFVDPRFVLTDADTLPALLEHYDRVAAATDELVATGDLDATRPLPSAPWFEPGAEWSLRRVLLHVIAETSQHAGHADIIREAIDGAKTMG
ncbi:DinB family protein [Pseudonocardia kujensis]|uniref:DinB family protein n=1 Tax=Pseudonocardia kujensis TaxID=1128675 RepID=UPI001E528966|nr:DinB family protein [Pseudonocardia kujensis]MCE0764664.1 DinB family protein [Pseudonocardia kujensis]